MTTYEYAGKLTDFSESPFPNASPRLWVAPEQAAMTSTNALATKRVQVPVSSNGNFTVTLVASADLSPKTRYLLRVEWLDGSTVMGWTEWKFTALIGGGNIGSMTDGEPTNVWYSVTPPPVERKGIYWIDPATGEVKEWY